VPQKKRMSEQYPEAWDDSALPRRRRDLVEINVGGRNFAAAISTLRANSSYFDALFSREWYSEEETVFVDQDPDVFAILQSFIRLRSIDSTKVTEDVLLQAEFLGMDRLLAAVKCVAYCNMNPNFTGSDEEAVTGFDLKYQGITEAFSLGVLPKYLTEQKGQQKDYASITVHETWLAPKGDRYSYISEMYVDVHVTDDVTDHSVEDGSLPDVVVPDCHRFLDALNWLHKHGYTARESDFDSMHEGSSSIILLFSKKVQQRTASTGLSNLIRTKTKATHEEDCKQFAALVYWKMSCKADVQADVGTVCEYSDVLETWTWNTRISNHEHDTLVDGMNWLHKEGYTTQEDSLGALYERFTSCECEEPDPGFTVRIYSRPL
jgi:hypothetical protein